LTDDSLTSLLVILALIVLRGVLALGYGAISNVRQNVLRERVESGNKSASRVLKLTEDPNLQITVQIVTLLLHFAIAAIAVLNFKAPLLNVVSDLSPTLAYAIVLLITACVTLVVGELVPEAVGGTYALQLSSWFASPLRLLITLFRPVTVVLVFASKALSSLFKSSELVNTVTEEEIMTLVETGQAGGTIEQEEKEMIFSVLQLDETYASEVMVPRIDLKALEIDATIEDARAIFINSGYSRIPVYEDTIDNIKGLLYAKDLLAYWHNGQQGSNKVIGDLLRPAYFVPATKPADDLLKELQAKSVHMAVVVDEFGGTAGIVTIENIIEEIIGDIRDEYDHEEAEYTEISENVYVVDAGIDLDDFNDLLDVELPTEDSDTLGGYIYSHIGHVPVEGEEVTVEEEGLTMRIQSVEGRRIRKVHVTKVVPQKTEASSDGVATAETTTVVEDLSNNEENTDIPRVPDKEAG
jgi:putative hemolysin